MAFTAPARQRTTPTPAAVDMNALWVGPWLRLPDLPEGKEQMGLEACAGKIYAVAGIRDGEETGSAFVYDPNVGQWSPIAPLPREVQSLCLRAVKGRLFSFGGYHHRWAIKYRDVWVYDPNANAWLPRAPLPVPREDAGSAVINGQVWILGGLTNPGHQLVPQIDIYDPDLDAWVLSFTLKPHDGDWPGRALGDFACAVDGAIWCLAGTETTENYPFLRPDSLGFFATETGLGYLPIPDPRCYAELEVIGTSLFIVGGTRTSTMDYADTMLILDVPTQTWKKPVPLPYGARGQSVCSCNGLLYVAGGYDGRTRKDFFLWMDDAASESP
jgi:N-acetylneuraminic acid mutarotase